MQTILLPFLACFLVLGCRHPKIPPNEPRFTIHGEDTLDTHPDGWWEHYNAFGEKYEAGRYRKGKRDGVWTRWYSDGLIALGRFTTYQDSAAYVEATQNCPWFDEAPLNHWLEWSFQWNAPFYKDGKGRWNVKDGTWWYFDFRKKKFYLTKFCAGESSRKGN